MQICCPVSLFNLPFRWESAGVGSKLQRQLDPRGSIRNPPHNAHVFRLDTVALQHNSFVSCHSTVTLEHSSNVSALALKRAEKSTPRHMHEHDNESYLSFWPFNPKSHGGVRWVGGEGKEEREGGEGGGWVGGRGERGKGGRGREGRGDEERRGEERRGEERRGEERRGEERRGEERRGEEVHLPWGKVKFDVKGKLGAGLWGDFAPSLWRTSLVPSL